MIRRFVDFLCLAALVALTFWLFPWEPGVTLQNQLLEWSEMGRKPAAER